MLPDAPTLLIIAAASCVVVPVALLIRAAWKAADDFADEIPDWDRAVDHCGWVDVPNDPSRGAYVRGRDVSQAGESSGAYRENLPNDPSRGGTVRAFNEQGFGRVPPAPGSHPSGHAAFGVDGASRFDPIARGNGRAFHEGE
jgi:hypothetical protein